MNIEKLISNNDWTFLNDVYDILRDGNVLNTNSSEPVVEFKHPNELKVSKRKEISIKFERFRFFFFNFTHE